MNATAHGQEPRGETFPRRARLRRRVDFERVLKRGFRVHGRLLVIYLLPSDLTHSRLGLTVSRRVGSAPRRNRVKRRLRELFRRELRQRLDRELRPADVVVRAEPDAGMADQAALREELDAALQRWKDHGLREGSRRARAVERPGGARS